MRRVGIVLIHVALFSSLAIPREPLRAQAASYTFHQISDGFSPAMDVNDDGTVVGWWLGPLVSTDPNSHSRGYVWTLATGPQPMISDSTLVNKFPFYTAVNDPAAPLRVNGNGTIVGTGCPSGCGIGYNGAAAWSASSGLTFLGSFDPTSDVGSVAAGVNGAEQVVGTSSGGGYNSFGPFTWSAATGLQHLAGFDGINGYATAINSNGQVVGSKGLGSRNVPFVWSATSGMTQIPDVSGGASTSDGFAINDFGVVVGRYLAPDNMTYGVFSWSMSSGTSDLNAPSGYPELMDINNAGDIVVTIIQSGRRVPYLYQAGTWIDINTLLPVGANFTLQFAEAISNRGWIVGAGSTDPSGAELLQGFVLVPPNHAPVAYDGTLTTAANTAASGTLQATDADGDALTFNIVTNGSKGTATVTDASTGAFTYVPHLNATGPDVFTFNVNDGIVDSDVASVSVTIEPACATDVSNSVSVSSGALRLNRKTGRYTQAVTLRNGDGVISGPVSLVLDDLSSNTSLFNAVGATSCLPPLGSPYTSVDLGRDGTFTPRERITLTLEFANPSGAPVTYSPRVLAGPGDR